MPMNDLVTIDSVKSRLVTVRGQTALLDRDVAALYGVETRIVLFTRASDLKGNIK